MRGWPVWLASLSYRSPLGHIVPTERWTAERREWGDHVLNMLLAPVGDEAREREFRMCITLCRHRAATTAEVAALPQWWHDAPPVHLAGGSLEVLWTRGVEDDPSVRPCENYDRQDLGGGLFLPIDCGQCGPCRAREAWVEKA